MFQDYCQEYSPSEWTTKRLLEGIVDKHTVPKKKNDIKINLGQSLDWFRKNPSSANLKGVASIGGHKARWSASLDLARLLMIMFGCERARAAFVKSQQLPSRARLDDTTLRSLKVEYWLKISKYYNNSDEFVEIDVGIDIVNLWLKSHLHSKYRVDWPAPKLCEQFMKVRADYESSQEKDNYDRSGQNSDLFYPNFNTTNAAHVMLHYLLRQVPRGSVLGDLPANAVVDTGVNEGAVTDDTDMSAHSESDAQSEAERKAEVTEEKKPPRYLSKPQRRLYSPASSIASSASAGRGYSRSRSRGRGRGRGHRDNNDFLGGAQRSLKRACDTILNSFERMQDEHRRKERHARQPASRDDDVITRGNRALQLINTKKRIVAEIEQLKGVGADADDLQLLEINLRMINNEIKKYLEV